MMQTNDNSLYENYEGYSPAEMYLILVHLLRKDCPVQLAEFTDETCNPIPLFRQVKMLLASIEKEGELKLTVTGNLPVRIVKDIYSVGVPDSFVDKGFMNLRSETDSSTVQLTRVAAQLMKAIKITDKKLSLTKRGEELLSSNSKLLTELLNSMFKHLDLSAYDFYSSANIGNIGIGFNLILLAKYGQTGRKAAFYAKKYFKAFPILLEEAAETYTPTKEVALNCYSLRVFKILFQNLGLVTVEHTIIRRTDIFDKLFLIK